MRRHAFARKFDRRWQNIKNDVVVTIGLADNGSDAPNERRHAPA